VKPDGEGDEAYGLKMLGDPVSCFVCLHTRDSFISPPYIPCLIYPAFHGAFVPAPPGDCARPRCLYIASCAASLRPWIGLNTPYASSRLSSADEAPCQNRDAPLTTDQNPRPISNRYFNNHPPDEIPSYPPNSVPRPTVHKRATGGMVSAWIGR